MVQVKICGIKKKSDIEIVNRYMPEYVGFVFAESKRKVTYKQAAELALKLDKKIRKVGVFVNEAPDRIVDILDYCGLDFIQLHGDETPEYIRQLSNLIEHRGGFVPQIWKSVKVKKEFSMAKLLHYPVNAFVLDSYSQGSYGGTGKTFNWNAAVEIGNKGNIILAGGLNKHNVLEALNIIKPFAVDISSGVETNNCKDEKKVKAFIKTVRSYKHNTD